jgi:site-specific DNA-methyltransferase (adenine-specific)
MVRGEEVRVEQIGDATLYCGDALEILPTLSGVDAVVTDPPYSSGARTSVSIRARTGMTRGAMWADESLMNDRMTTTGFVWMLRHVAMDCGQILSDGGSFLCFIDWRQYPQLYGAIETCNLRIQNLVVWDKVDIGMGNGFRNRHELLIHASRGVPRVYHKGTANVIACKRIASSEIHPTEKPIYIYHQILPVVTELDQIVLDPFMGSGTTGVACANLGRKFIGIEIEPKYFDIACERIERAYQQPRLFDDEELAQPEQLEL